MAKLLIKSPGFDNQVISLNLGVNRFGRSLGNALPVEVLQAEDIANAVAWLVSDQARYITGVTLPVDAGFLNK